MGLTATFPVPIQIVAPGEITLYIVHAVNTLETGYNFDFIFRLTQLAT